MDSPETVKVTTTITTTTTTTTATTTISDSAAGQDSPIFGYISNLSPIKPVTSAPVPLGFLGLNSPPIVFTSPRINPLQEQSYPKRLQYTHSSSADLYHLDDRGKKVSTGAYSHTKKESDDKCSNQDQSSSLSGSVDQYLSGAVEVECVESAHSDASCLKQSDDGAQSLNDFTDSKESISRLDNKTEERKDSEKEPQVSSIEETKAIDIESNHGRDEMPSSVYPKVEHSLSLEHAYEAQHCEPVVQHAGAANEDELTLKSQLLAEDEDGRETTAEATTEPVDNVILIDSKASQHHRGIRRRCLQFEEAQQHNILVNHSGSWNPSNSATSSKSPASPSDSEVLESFHAERSSIPGPGQLVNLNPPNITVSKPSGIGLHLNSIINSVPLACGATASMKSAERGYVFIQGKKFVSVTGSSNFSNAKISTRTEDGNRETRASTAASSLSPRIVKPLYTPVLLKPSVSQATPCDKRKSNSESSDTVEELSHLNPKKKRKKASNSSDDGCKRCNCKKTKCLKLYCDCFAAGIYCAETCACQGCFNRPEYEDTVLGTRQQIESRNPLAFAPKIEDGNRSTPTSARHKRGCNCKKSMCLKKYCECYQANVGCSDGCRCEGCQNVYGHKEGYGMTKDAEKKWPLNKRLEGASDERLEIVAITSGFSDFGHSHNLTPLTPSLQCSDQGKNSSKSRFPSRRYTSSPESGLALLPPYEKSPRSPRNYDNHQELDSTNAEAIDEFSPRYDGRDVHNLGTLLDPKLIAMASSNSPDTSEWTNVSRAQFVPGNSRLPPASSLRWRSSPITPMTQFGGPELLQVLDSETSLYDILEDDTPEILKDASTPLNTVKVSSPNKKRVSPPHSRLHEVGFSSSAGVRSGRKFILQAVPSFPPLTPCVNSNGRTNQNINDPQDCSSNK